MSPRACQLSGLLLGAWMLGGCGAAPEGPRAEWIAFVEVASDRSREDAQRLSALHDIGACGVPAGDAAPALTDILLHENESAALKDAAAQALFQVGGAYAGVERFERELLKLDATDSQRAQAAAALRRSGTLGLQALRRAVREARPPARDLARDELRAFRVAADDPGIETAALEIAQDLQAPPRDFDPVAECAPQLLGRLGPLALPQVQLLLADDRPHVRTWALEAVCEMGPAAASIAADLRRLLQDPDADVRSAASEALNAVADKSPSSS